MKGIGYCYCYCYCYCLRLTCSSLWKGGGLDRWHRSRWRRSRPGTWNDTRTRIDIVFSSCLLDTYTHTHTHTHTHTNTHTNTQAHKQGHKEEPAGDLERHQDKNRQEEETPLFLSHTQAQAHKQGHVSPFPASTAPRSGALTSIQPLPPSFLPVIQDK